MSDTLATTKGKRNCILDLQRQLLELEKEDSNRAMSDDRWYSNGGSAAMQAQMRVVRQKIAAIQGSI